MCDHENYFLSWPKLIETELGLVFASDWLWSCSLIGCGPGSCLCVCLKTASA